MARPKAIFFVKCLTFWCWLKESYSWIAGGIASFYKHTASYFHHDTWLLIPDHTLPLSSKYDTTMMYTPWTYQPHTNILQYNDGSSIYKLSWLSVKIVNKRNDSTYEYDIDSFLNTFRIHSFENNCPTLYFIFLSWCIYSKQWFSPRDTIEFHLIDHMGEQRFIALNDPRCKLEIRDNKVYDSLN